jgi:hypothetical protein
MPTVKMKGVDMYKIGRIALFIGVALLIGCRTAYKNEESGRFVPGHDSEGTKPGLRVADPNFPESAARLNNAGILDDSLRYKIAIEATNSRRSATQTLEVWAELRNRTDFPLTIECRVRWYDKSKAPVDEPTAWQKVFLEPNSLGVFKELSTSVYEIAYYYIEIREAR